MPRAIICYWQQGSKEVSISLITHLTEKNNYAEDFEMINVIQTNISEVFCLLEFQRYSWDSKKVNSDAIIRSYFGYYSMDKMFQE